MHRHSKQCVIYRQMLPRAFVFSVVFIRYDLSVSFSVPLRVAVGIFRPNVRRATCVTGEFHDAIPNRNRS